MKTRAMLSTIAGASLAACLTACGDPLVTAEDHGDALFGVHGQAISADGKTPASELEVAVVFLRLVLSPYPPPPPPPTGPDDPGPGPDRLEIEVIPGVITGDFPAKFSVKLTEKPTVYPYNINTSYGTIGGAEEESMDGVFASSNAPEGVRIGHLVIGPAAELAALPAAFDIPPFQRTLGNALAPYLPTTTITPYQVIYAEGVGSGDVIYPQYTEDGIVPGTGKAIKNGFTLVDARTFFEATIWQECAAPFVMATFEGPEYQACLAANAALIECLDVCDPFDEPCASQCRASYPDQIDSQTCLRQLSAPLIEAGCGAAKLPNRDQLRILRPQDALSVTLVEDDVKAGLWVLHATVP